MSNKTFSFTAKDFNLYYSKAGVEVVAEALNNAFSQGQTAIIENDMPGNKAFRAYVVPVIEANAKFGASDTDAVEVIIALWNANIKRSR